jgi:tetratricopeptide (TPR) repeat protein
LVRKSLIEVTRSSGQARYSMLETIRQFAEEQLAATGDGDQVREVHVQYYAGREPEVMEQWTGNRSREAIEWVEREFANLRGAYRWAADRGNVESAATIALMAAFTVGAYLNLSESIRWVEELIPAAGAANHRLLIALYQAAVECVYSGRAEESIAFAEAAQALYGDGRFEENLYGFANIWPPAAYLYIGRPDLMVEGCRANLEREEDPLAMTATMLVLSLAYMGDTAEAVSLAGPTLEAAERTGNPVSLATALMAFGIAFTEVDSPKAMEALRRSVKIYREAGDFYQSFFALAYLASVEVKCGEQEAALEHLGEVIQRRFDDGDTDNLPAPLAMLSTLLSSVGMSDEAAVVAGHANTPIALATYHELPATVERLRAQLDTNEFDALAARGAAMTTADIVRYAFDAIETATAKVRS